MDGMHDLGGKQGFGRGPLFAERARRFTRRGKRASTRSIRSRSSSASSTWTSTATRSSAWSRATICRRATTSARSPAWRRSASRRASSRARSSSAARTGAFPAVGARARPGRTNVAERERFKPGDRVRVRTDHVPGHVRMPGYIRGKTGVVVERVAGLSLSRCPRARRGRRRTSPPTTCASMPRSCGRTRPTLPSCTSACSRAIWSGQVLSHKFAAEVRAIPSGASLYRASAKSHAATG